MAKTQDKTMQRPQTMQNLSAKTIYSKSRALFISLASLFVMLFSSAMYAIEFPLDFHGKGYIGKYLNNANTSFSMDASIDIYCTMIKHKNFSFFMRYRDDLDMAQPRPGVIFDPRYAHYYIVGGFDYILANLLFSMYFMHDCIHNIDYEIEETPIFNRFRLVFANADAHFSKHLISSKRFLWSIEFGYYAHWQYHGWDINYGTDYKYDIILKPQFNLLKKRNFGIGVEPVFHITKGDTSYYHQHLFELNTSYRNNGKQIGLGITYNIWNNDILKNPDKLWLLSIFAEF